MRNGNSGKLRVGIVGSGYIGGGLLLALDQSADFQVTKMLTRRDPRAITGHPRPEILTNHIDELAAACDMVVECSGDVIHATAVIDQLLAYNLPVVTLDAEFQVTTGSYFVGKGVLSEAEGDQPGSLAALRENAVAMGFRPIVYGNVKAYLNHTPTPEDMRYWAGRNGISLDQVTAFTDGTKVQIEQVLVANGLGAEIAVEGMIGPQSENMVAGANALAQYAQTNGRVISDYIVSRDWSGAVFLVAEHHADQAPYLRYYKMGDGPAYIIPQPYHLCHLEVPKTMRRIARGEPALLDNSYAPRYSVAAVAKMDLQPGARIPRGLGSFTARGSAVAIADRPDHLPIGLLFDAVIRRPVEAGQTLTFDDVELPESLAVHAWRAIRDRALSPAREPAPANGVNGRDTAPLSPTGILWP